MFYITIVFLAALFVLYNLILVVPMRERCVIERLGKFRVVLEPGFHILIPFFDRVAYRHETREQCLNIPHQAVYLKTISKLMLMVCFTSK